MVERRVFLRKKNDSRSGDKRLSIFDMLISKELTSVHKNYVREVVGNNVNQKSEVGETR